MEEEETVEPVKVRIMQPCRPDTIIFSARNIPSLK